MVGIDRGGPQPAGAASWPERFVTSRGVRLEPARPLPARLLAKRGAELLEAVVRRWQGQGPARGAVGGPGARRGGGPRGRPPPCDREGRGGGVARGAARSA